jgi:hypothetical protein
MVLGNVLVTGLDQVAVQQVILALACRLLAQSAKTPGVVTRWHSIHAWASGGTLRSMRYSLTLAKLGCCAMAAKTIRPTLSKPMVKKSNVLLMGPAPFNRFIFVMVDESFLKIPKDRSKAV